MGGWGYDRFSRTFARAGDRFTWRSVGFEQTEQHPVVNVSWNDAIAFCEWLTREDGTRQFRLPTEAEWEYACRAGTASRYSWGDSAESLIGKENIADQSLAHVLAPGVGQINMIRQAAPWDDHQPFSARVGSLQPNRFGLSDMHGNVCEWVEDWFEETRFLSDGASASPAAESEKVFRGGSWGYGPANSRSASRHHFAPSDRWCNLGFRVVCEERQ